MTCVVLVEDNATNRILIEDLFAFDDIGAELVEFERAEAALVQIPMIDARLILMDVALPGMSGLEAVAQLKKNPRTCHIPVWALTAHAMKGDAEIALRAGCVAYITKPLDPGAFRRRLREFVCRLRGKEAA